MNQPGGAVVAEFVTITICWPCSFVPTYCSYCERNVSKVSTHLYNNWRLVIMTPLLWRQINEWGLPWIFFWRPRPFTEAEWGALRICRSAKGVVGELCVFGALIISGSHKPQVFRSINCQLIMWYYTNNNVTSGKTLKLAHSLRGYVCCEHDWFLHSWMVNHIRRRE